MRAPLFRRRRIRTPTRLQMEASECGAAALAIVLEHFGSYLPLAQLRQKCGVSRDGSKASNIILAAREYGCDARGYKKEPDELRQLELPAILHWNFNHFVVLEGFSRRRAHLNDPALGHHSVSLEEFDKAFTGVVLVIRPSADFQPAGRRPALLPELLPRLQNSWAALAIVVLAGLGLAVPGILIPTFAKIFVDDILLGGKLDWQTALFCAMGLAAVTRAALTAVQRTYLVRVIMKLGVSMSSRFLWHALRLPVGFFYARSAGDLANRVQLNDGVAATISAQLSRGLLDLLLLGFYALIMLCYDPALTLIGFGTAALQLVLLQLSARMRTDLSCRVANEEGKIAGVAASGLQMIETLKASGGESTFFEQWAGHQAKLVSVQQTLSRREQWIAAVVELLTRVNALLVVGAGALRVMSGDLTIGGLVAFESLMAGFMLSIEGLTRFGVSLQSLRGNLERLDDVQSHTRSTGAPSPASQATPRYLTGELTLRGVCFGYSSFAAPLVEALDLHVSPGQRVALIGGTGSGKSTIARLVTGLYSPWAGQILFDGVARECLPRELLCASVALVDQEISLFEGTVRENLTLWDDTIPEADMIQAAKDACIHEEITKLPGGYDAHVIEGGYNFSGGQRQRLELARALIRQPALLVLDEATSALDAETERRVDENLRRRGCSCLIVAHRLSTIRDCDEILVFERGRVVQRGSHDQLLAEGAHYAALIKAA